MSKRLVKYSLVAGLAMLLAAPAVAYSQRSTPQGPGFGAGFPGGPQAGRPGLANGPGGAAQGRFARAQGTGRQRNDVRPPAGRRGRGGDDGRPGRGSGRGAGLSTRVLAHADEIGLSAEQRDQVLAAQRAAREAQINRRAEAQIAGLELRELMGADTPDIAAIEARLRQVSEQRIADQIAGLRSDEAVRELLSAEQRAALDELGVARRNRRPDAGPARRGPRRAGR